MKSIQDLAREAGIDWDRLEDYSAYRVSALELQRFVTLVIAEEHKRLLEGGGEPIVLTESNDGTPTAYTADQMAAAVLWERERCAAMAEAYTDGDNADHETHGYAIAAAIRGVQ